MPSHPSKISVETPELPLSTFPFNFPFPQNSLVTLPFTRLSFLVLQIWGQCGEEKGTKFHLFIFESGDPVPFAFVVSAPSQVFKCSLNRMQQFIRFIRSSFLWFLLRPASCWHTSGLLESPPHLLALVFPCLFPHVRLLPKQFSKILLSFCQEPLLFMDLIETSLAFLSFESASFQHLFDVMFLLFFSPHRSPSQLFRTILFLVCARKRPIPTHAFPPDILLAQNSLADLLFSNHVLPKDLTAGSCVSRYSVNIC